MESYIAIFISVATFIFTIYQWLVVMNSRRPRILAVAFRPERISFSQKLDFLRIYMPEKWHIVNMADIPNAIMNFRLLVKAGGCWQECRFSNAYKMKNMLPLAVSGHTHCTFEDEPLNSGKTCHFQCDLCPSDAELANFKVKIEIEDQYGVIHSQILSDRDIRKEKIEEFPGNAGLYTDSDLSEILAEFTGQGTEEKYVINVVYYERYPGNTSRDQFPHILVHKHTRRVYAPWLGEDCRVSPEEQKIWDEAGKPARVQLDNWNDEETKIYLHFENDAPTQLEIEMMDKGNLVQKKMGLPAQLLETWK